MSMKFQVEAIALDNAVLYRPIRGDLSTPCHPLFISYFIPFFFSFFLMWSQQYCFFFQVSIYTRPVCDNFTLITCAIEISWLRCMLSKTCIVSRVTFENGSFKQLLSVEYLSLLCYSFFFLFFFLLTFVSISLFIPDQVGNLYLLTFKNCTSFNQ